MTEPANIPIGTLSLTDPVLFWVCYDTSNLVAVTVHQHLKSQAEFLSQRLSADQHGSVPSIGLFVWAIHEPAQFTVTLSALLQARKQNSPALLFVFLAPELLQYRLALIEAGAHIVVHEISQVPSVLSKCSGNLTLSREGVHPITSGLVARLPWAD
jgi:hypothetical protein